MTHCGVLVSYKKVLKTRTSQSVIIASKIAQYPALPVTADANVLYNYTASPNIAIIFSRTSLPLFSSKIEPLNLFFSWWCRRILVRKTNRHTSDKFFILNAKDMIDFIFCPLGIGHPACA